MQTVDRERNMLERERGFSRTIELTSHHARFLVDDTFILGVDIPEGGRGIKPPVRLLITADKTQKVLHEQQLRDGIKPERTLEQKAGEVETKGLNVSEDEPNIYIGDNYKVVFLEQSDLQPNSPHFRIESSRPPTLQPISNNQSHNTFLRERLLENQAQDEDDFYAALYSYSKLEFSLFKAGLVREILLPLGLTTIFLFGKVLQDNERKLISAGAIAGTLALIDYLVHRKELLYIDKQIDLESVHGEEFIETVERNDAEHYYYQGTNRAEKADKDIALRNLQWG